MIVPVFDSGRSASIRTGLVELVTTARPRRRRLWIGVGAVTMSTLLAGFGVTAAAGSILHWQPTIDIPAATPGGSVTHPAGGNPGISAPAGVIPGADVVRALGGKVSTPAINGDGSVTFDAPNGATHIRVWITTACAVANSVVAWGTGPGQKSFTSTCTPNDGATSTSSYDFPADAGRVLTVQAREGVSTAVTYQYLKKIPTRWGTNAQNQTFGVEKPGVGSPDLVAVEATNGRHGYALSIDLATAAGDPAALGFQSPTDALNWQREHQGTVAHVPVYESDGRTVIGQFDVE